MTDDIKRVYCKDCEWLRKAHSVKHIGTEHIAVDEDYCGFDVKPEISHHPVSGSKTTYNYKIKCVEKNKDCNCPNYDEKVPV